MKYKIFAALKEDINSGWVWVGDKTISERTIVLLVNKNNNKKIYCEALFIDENFLREYNNPPRAFIKNPSCSIVINSWYRKELGNIEPQSEYELEIKKVDNKYGKLRASLKHPQVAIRTAIKLALWSVALAIIGIIIGVLL